MRVCFWTLLPEMRSCSSWMGKCPADPWRGCVFGVVCAACVFAHRMVWLFSEGFASFSVSFEITMYAILDVINKVPSVIPC